MGDWERFHFIICDLSNFIYSLHNFITFLLIPDSIKSAFPFNIDASNLDDRAYLFRRCAA